MNSTESLKIAVSAHVLYKFGQNTDEWFMLLIWLSMWKKSSCVRVGPRHKVTCAKITSIGDNLRVMRHAIWVFFIVCHSSFIVCIDNAKMAFIVRRIQSLPKLVAFSQGRWYLSIFSRNVYKSLFMVGGMCLKEYHGSLDFLVNLARQTDGRRHRVIVNVSSRSLKTEETSVQIFIPYQIIIWCPHQPFFFS